MTQDTSSGTMSSMVPVSPKHVVVIGAGIGGLAAAIELRAAGLDVTLVERQSAPGGKMREVDVAGVGIDSGPTVFTMRWVFEELFAAAGQSFAERVSLSNPHRLARHSWLDGSRLDLFADIDRSADAIRDFAGPREADGYRRFAAASADIFEALDHTFMRSERPGPFGLTVKLGIAGIPRLLRTSPFSSMWNVLGRYFNDPRLRQLFGRYATYCGSSPYLSPATLVLIAHAERAGVWLVDGGMQRLAEALADSLIDIGATLRFEQEVSTISTRNGRAVGVELGDGTGIEADAVVFNGDVAALPAGLLGRDVARAAPPRPRDPRSLSAVTWSVRGRATGFPLDHHTVFFGDDYSAEFDAIFRDGVVTQQPTVYVCAQDRGHGRSASDNGAERLFLLVNAPPRRLAADDVASIADRTFAHLGRHGLEIDSGRDVELTTPGDFAERFPGSEGAIYGWPTHGWSGSFRRMGSRSRVPGLYLAGGTVHPGPGVPMTAISGRLAAASVLADL